MSAGFRDILAMIIGWLSSQPPPEPTYGTLTVTVAAAGSMLAEAVAVGSLSTSVAEVGDLAVTEG